jgi:hypothetical protein
MPPLPPNMELMPPCIAPLIAEPARLPPPPAPPKIQLNAVSTANCDARFSRESKKELHTFFRPSVTLSWPRRISASSLPIERRVA